MDQGSNQLLYINVQRFREGLVFKAQTVVSLNSRLESNKEEEEVTKEGGGGEGFGFGVWHL